MDKPLPLWLEAYLHPILALLWVGLLFGIAWLCGAFGR